MPDIKRETEREKKKESLSIKKYKMTLAYPQESQPIPLPTILGDTAKETL